MQAITRNVIQRTQHLLRCYRPLHAAGQTMVKRTIQSAFDRSSGFDPKTGEKQDAVFKKPEYDEIVDGYDNFRSKDDKIWLLEMHNTAIYVPPLVKGKTVLELACGSGFYAYELAKWGATSVLAVDLSIAMLEKARNLPESREEWASRVTFSEADCRVPSELPGSPFDVVFSAYYLPTAIDEETLIQYYKMAFVNLKEGGSFFSVVVPPSDDHVAYFDQERAAVAEFGINSPRELWKEIPGGITYRNRIRSGKDWTYFYGHRLIKSVYAEAARKAGFVRSPINWLDLHTPSDDDPRVKKQVRCPDFGLQVVEK